MEVVSYPGPVAGIDPYRLLPGVSVPPTRPRNPRIGEFLEPLGLVEEWLISAGRRCDSHGPDPRALQEFAQAKLWLAQDAGRKRNAAASGATRASNHRTTSTGLS